MITWWAPAAFANDPFLGELTVVTTVAPDQRANWTAALPTAPAPPCTRTVSPVIAPGPRCEGPRSRTVRARCAVRAGIPIEAPTSKLTPSGKGTTRLIGCTTYSAAVPEDFPCWARITQTRSP